MTSDLIMNVILSIINDLAKILEHPWHQAAMQQYSFGLHGQPEALLLFAKYK